MQAHKLLSVLGLAGLVAVTGAALAQSQTTQKSSPQPQPSGQSAPKPDDSMQGMPGMDMGNMKMGNDDQDHVESGAMHAMQPGHHMEGSHMHMTSLHPVAAGDRDRAEQIVEALRPAIDKYKDYRVALADGFRIFAPNLPQPEYHFTSAWNGFVESFTFDPARPTSLLYKKLPGGGWELIGAMYTAPRTATLDQLNERVPLSMAQWHVHTNLCIPKRGGLRDADWSKFGLDGSISTAEACDAAGGRFFPQIFGWMVHVYPYRAADKIWEQ
jgi:hypothetical protein